MSQKYGDTLLPASISKTEFEAILGAVREESLKLEAEAAAEEEERAAQAAVERAAHEKRRSSVVRPPAISEIRQENEAADVCIIQ